MMNYRDPRLADLALLAVAAQRLRYRLEHPQPPAWWLEGEGISSLIEAGRRLPPRTPEEEAESVYENAPGFGGLLWEARQRNKEQGHGA